MKVYIVDIAREIFIGKMGGDRVKEISLCSTQTKPWSSHRFGWTKDYSLYTEDVVLNDDCFIDVKELLREMEERNLVLKFSVCMSSKYIIPISKIVSVSYLREIAESKGWI